MTRDCDRLAIIRDSVFISKSIECNIFQFRKYVRFVVGIGVELRVRYDKIDCHSFHKKKKTTKICLSIRLDRWQRHIECNRSISALIFPTSQQQKCPFCFGRISLHFSVCALFRSFVCYIMTKFGEFVEQMKRRSERNEKNATTVLIWHFDYSSSFNYVFHAGWKIKRQKMTNEKRTQTKFSVKFVTCALATAIELEPQAKHKMLSTKFISFRVSFRCFRLSVFVCVWFARDSHLVCDYMHLPLPRHCFDCHFVQFI